jgi:hypothetical protein
VYWLRCPARTLRGRFDSDCIKQLSQSKHCSKGLDSQPTLLEVSLSYYDGGSNLRAMHIVNHVINELLRDVPYILSPWTIEHNQFPSLARSSEHLLALVHSLVSQFSDVGAFLPLQSFWCEHLVLESSWCQPFLWYQPFSGRTGRPKIKDLGKVQTWTKSEYCFRTHHTLSYHHGMVRHFLRWSNHVLRWTTRTPNPIGIHHDPHQKRQPLPSLTLNDLQPVW